MLVLRANMYSDSAAPILIRNTNVVILRGILPNTSHWPVFLHPCPPSERFKYPNKVGPNDFFVSDSGSHIRINDLFSAVVKSSTDWSAALRMWNTKARRSSGCTSATMKPKVRLLLFAPCEDEVGIPTYTAPASAACLHMTSPYTHTFPGAARRCGRGSSR